MSKLWTLRISWVDINGIRYLSPNTKTKGFDCAFHLVSLHGKLKLHLAESFFPFRSEFRWWVNTLSMRKQKHKSDVITIKGKVCMFPLRQSLRPYMAYSPCSLDWWYTALHLQISPTLYGPYIWDQSTIPRMLHRIPSVGHSFLVGLCASACHAKLNWE